MLMMLTYHYDKFRTFDLGVELYFLSFYPSLDAAALLQSYILSISFSLCLWLSDSLSLSVSLSNSVSDSVSVSLVQFPFKIVVGGRFSSFLDDVSIAFVTNLVVIGISISLFGSSTVPFSRTARHTSYSFGSYYCCVYNYCGTKETLRLVSHNHHKPKEFQNCRSNLS